MHYIQNIYHYQTIQSNHSYSSGISYNIRIHELHLRNLGLLSEVSGIKQLHINEICKRFTNLRLLDGEPITNINLNLISFGDGICMEQSQITDFISQLL